MARNSYCYGERQSSGELSIEFGATTVAVITVRYHPVAREFT